MRIHFVFIGEGRSDEGLLSHIERVLIAVGATEVTGTAPDFGAIPAHAGHTVASKLRTVVELEPSANLIIIHRDSDGRDPQPRYDEIAEAVAGVTFAKQWVAIVPVQETEAWVLLDEAAIRAVAGNPNSKQKLGLPRPQDVERLAKPKEFLNDALVTASELSGRRAAKFRNSLPARRKQLLEQLPVGGKLEHVDSWVRFREHLAQALKRMM